MRHDTTRVKPDRLTGIKHLFATLTYSAKGLKRVWRETAFRQEIVAAGIILGLFYVVGASPTEFVFAVILMLILFAIEVLNTAIEELVDHISPNWAEFAYNAKNLGSLAVLCLLLANGAFAVQVLYTRIFVDP